MVNENVGRIVIDEVTKKISQRDRRNENSEIPIKKKKPADFVKAGKGVGGVAGWRRVGRWGKVGGRKFKQVEE